MIGRRVGWHHQWCRQGQRKKKKDPQPQLCTEDRRVIEEKVFCTWMKKESKRVREQWISVSSCCEEQADKRRGEKVQENKIIFHREKKNMQRKGSHQRHPDLIQKQRARWAEFTLSSTNHTKYSTYFTITLENCMTSEWSASPAEESRRTIWKLFLIWSVTFPHDLDAGPLIFRRQDLLRLCLPFVGAEVGARLQRLMLLSFGERAPLIGRLVSGRVVWIVAPTVLFQIPQYELPQRFNCGGMKTPKWKKIMVTKKIL